MEPLIAALSDTNTQFREACVRALGEIKDARAVEPLVAILEDYNVDRVVARVLQSFEWQPVCKKQEALLAVALDDWDKAASIGVQAVPPLAAILKESTYSPRYSLASRALIKIGADGVTLLAEMLKDQDRMLRKAVAALLGEIGDTHAVEPLAAAINDDDRQVRLAVVEALGKLAVKSGSESALVPLMNVFEDEGWQDKSSAAILLGGLGVFQALVPLLEAIKLGYRNPLRDVAVIHALGRIGDDRAVEYLIPALEYSSEMVFAQTAVASLEAVLTRAAARIEGRHLRILASIQKSFAHPRMEPILGHRLPGPTTYRAVDGEFVYTSVSCSQVNSLARKELERRLFSGSLGQ